MFRLFTCLVVILFACISAADNNEEGASEASKLIAKGNLYAMKFDYAEAENLYRKAATLNEPSAYYYLGLLELNGYGRVKSLNNAVSLYTKSAELGYSQAQYELSVIYSVAEYGLVNNQKYLNWLTKAANNNHKLACHNLASIAVRVGKTATGIAYYKKAAAQDHLPSIMSLAMIFYSGIGTAKNYPLSLKYLTLAAEQDDLEAVRLLATLSERGLGVDKNIDKAISLYTKAYQAGNLDAGFNLALLYFDNDNKQMAKSLLTELSNEGMNKAKSYLSKLDK